MGAAVQRQRIEIPYSPRAQFLAYHYRKQRWACVVAHRRCGKTVACVNDLIKGALICPKPNPRLAYIAPLHVQAKDVAWGYVKHYSLAIPGVQINESELRVDFPNGGRVRLYGADNYDRLRGIYLDGVILDEFADMDPRVWPEVIRPALSDRQGWATFIGTPKGRNAFYETFEVSKDRDDWFSLRLKASETGIVPAAELDDARSMMTPEQYAQEYEVSFEAAIIGAYYGREIAEAEREGRICDVPYDINVPVHAAWDLGTGANMAVWLWQVVGKEIHVIDYHEGAHADGIAQTVVKLRAKGYPVNTDWVPHDARAKEISSGRTRVEQLLANKRNPRLIPDHKVMDGIAAARLTIPRCYFDKSNCAEGLEALRQYRSEFDEKAKVFKNNPRHDWCSHSADAFRYLAMAWREIVPQPEKKPSAITVREYTVDEIVKQTFKDRKFAGNRI